MVRCSDPLWDSRAWHRALTAGLDPYLCSVSTHEYSFVNSEPLGRDQYKEMYLFVYR